MRPSSLLTQTVTVETVADSTVDVYGDPAQTITTTRAFGGYTWQVTAMERTGAGDLQTVEWKLAVEDTAAGFINARSRIVVDGVSFEVLGAPWTVKNPRTGIVSHVEATMRRTDG